MSIYKYNILEILQKNVPTYLKYATGGFALLSLGLIGLYKLQSKIIYHPIVPGLPQSPSNNPIGYRDPTDFNLPYENIQIVTKDKVNLKGWFIKQPQQEKVPTVIFFHENAGNIGSRLDYLSYYYEIVKVNLVIVAYRGYSDSDVVPINQKGLQQDVECILDNIFQRNDIDRNRIFTHGRSLGGACTAYGCSLNKYNIRGSILENTFTSIKDVGKNILPNYIMSFADLVLVNKWETLKLINQIKIPVLFIKSLQDELVPQQQMQELFLSLESNKKRMYVIQEGDHNSNWQVDIKEYFEQLALFINDVEQNKFSNL